MHCTAFHVIGLFRFSCGRRVVMCVQFVNEAAQTQHGWQQPPPMPENFEIYTHTNEVFLMVRRLVLGRVRAFVEANDRQPLAPDTLNQLLTLLPRIEFVLNERPVSPADDCVLLSRLDVREQNVRYRLYSLERVRVAYSRPKLKPPLNTG